LTLSSHSSNALLPTFYNKLQRKANGEIDSTKITTLFSDLLKKLVKAVDKYVGDDNIDEEDITHNTDTDTYQLKNLNTGLTSHCARKCTINAMADSVIPCYSWVFRVGLIWRAVSTMFDYLFPSKTGDRRSGRVLSGWNYRVNDNYYGGAPPTLEDILDDKELAKTTAEFFFHQHIQAGLDKKVGHLLFASILFNYERFVSLINDEPHGKYSQNLHPFVRKVKEKFETMGLDAEKIGSWTTNIRTQYINRNLLGLPMSCIPAAHLSSFLIDGRTFQDLMAHNLEVTLQLRAQLATISAENLQQRRSIKDLQCQIHLLTSQVQLLSSLVTKTYSLLESFLQRNGTESRASLDTVEDDKGKSVGSRVCARVTSSFASYSDLLSSFKQKCTSLADKYVAIFRDKYDLLYKDKPGAKTTYERQMNQTIKLVIRSMVCLAEEKPCERPDNVTELSRWLTALKEQGKRAEEKLLHLVGIDLKEGLQSPPLSTLVEKLTNATTRLPPVPQGCPAWLLVTGFPKKRKNVQDADAPMEETEPSSLVSSPNPPKKRKVDNTTVLPLNSTSHPSTH
jgi:hypothetical protein